MPSKEFDAKMADPTLKPVACPRCEGRGMFGVRTERSHTIRGYVWIDTDCVACEGTGWTFEAMPSKTTEPLTSWSVKLTETCDDSDAYPV